MEKNNFQYVAKYAVIIITDDTEEHANETLREYVKNPLEFKLVSTDPI